MSEAPRDLYSRLDEIDEATLRSIADVLELRGRHPRQVEIREGYLKLLPDLAGQDVLDLGCGTGVVARELARRVGPRGKVVGVDSTPTFVEVAEALRLDVGFTNLRFEVGDGRRLALPSASFDAVLAVTVLSHLPDREQVVRELRRVAKFGGRVLIVDGDYAANQLDHPDRALTERIIAAWRQTTVDDPFLARRLVPLIRACALDVEEVVGHAHVEAGQVEEASSFIWQWSMFAARQAVGAGAVTQAEADGWLDTLSELNITGQLFGSVNYVSVLAHRR
jgi:ubiquinone/menaquinone biosynthesis C-methylase UbiE